MTENRREEKCHWLEQGWIHGHQLRTGGQERKCAFSHFLTQSPWRTDGPTDGWTDKASYRVACPQLKMITMSKGRPCFLKLVSVLYRIVKVSSHCMDGLTKKEILTMSKGRTLFRWSNWVSCSIYSIIFPSHSYDSQMRSCCSIFHEVPTSELRSFFMNIVLTVGTTLILPDR